MYLKVEKVAAPQNITRRVHYNITSGVFCGFELSLASACGVLFPNFFSFEYVWIVLEERIELLVLLRKHTRRLVADGVVVRLEELH